MISPGCVTTRLKIDGKSLDRYIEESEILGKSFSGFLLYDPEKGTILHEYQGHRFFTPASNTKIFTFYTSKKILGDSIPSMAYAMIRDTLYFTGLGDPTFLHPDFEYQPGFDLLKQGKKPLVYIPNLFLDKRFGPGWAWDDYPYAYSTEKSAFPLYGNMIRIRKMPMDSGIQIIPRVLNQQAVIRRDTTYILDPGGLLINREEFSNRLEISFQEPLYSLDEMVPFMANDSLTSILLEDTLKKTILIRHEFPEVQQNILYSQPTDSLLKPMMIESDNFFAEQLLLMSSTVLYDTLSSEKAIDFAMLNYFPEFKDEMDWTDASGLSRYNQFTPYAISGVLARIYEEFGKDYISDIFPTGGISGTMKNNFPHLSGIVYAKTGSMSHVYNLSGYLVTRKGKWLIFSFMNNNFVKPPGEIRMEMTRILLSIWDKF
jgi:D-alanyl-D-alanine carboxypeptidase/D-alanyl-D-alanine-endopeptidase (penicillin-binding protein 4)